MGRVVVDRVVEDAGNQPDASTAYDLSGSAETGFRTFASVCSDTDTCIVLAEQVDADGVPSGVWEITDCTFNDLATDTLTRDTVISSSDGGLAINWSSSGATPRLRLVFSSTVADAVTSHAQGYRKAFTLAHDSLTQITVGAGEVMVDGQLVKKTSATTLSNTDIPAGAITSDNDVDVLYIWINTSGTITAELYSAGTPTEDTDLDYTKQGSDATKRLLWAINVQNDGGTKEFTPFTAVLQGRQCRYDVYEDNGITNHTRILNGGTSSTWAAVAADAATQRKYIPSITKEAIIRFRMTVLSTGNASNYIALNWNNSPAGGFQAWTRIRIDDIGDGATGVEFPNGLYPYSSLYYYLTDGTTEAYMHYRGYVAYL